MSNNRDDPDLSEPDPNFVRFRAVPMLSEISHSTSQALHWWRQRQQQRRELKLLCAREFAAQDRALRSRHP